MNSDAGIFVISLIMKIRSPWWIIWKKKMNSDAVLYYYAVVV
jgi:hypothetical protein